MDNMKRCCKRSWSCCGVPEDEVDIAKALAFSEVPSEDRITQLLADIEHTLGKGGDVKKVPMSKEVEDYASHLQKHLNKVILGAQISKDALNALGTLHWVGAGLTIIAMGLNMTLKTLDNKEQCSNIMKESLDIWKKVMKPVLETKGLASDFMGESFGIIIEGYLYCNNLINSRTWKRFICASIHEKELEMWKKKQLEFLVKASAVMSADLIGKLSSTTPTTPRTFPTTLVGLEGRKRDVMKLLKLEDKEETRVVVLHGMGGVGKSALADAVYMQVSISRERRRCRIELGEKPIKEHITSLQRRMVEDLTGESFNIMERDPEFIRDKLRQVLSLSEKGEPVLIYMDNILQSKDLEELLCLDCELIKLPKGSRVLVTTRDKSVCNNVFQRNPGFRVEEYPVKVLSDRDAEKLFFLHAFGQKEPSAAVVERYDDGCGLIKEMVNSICGNLPLALRVLGRSLFNTSVHSWRKKYNDLKIFEKIEQGERVTNVVKSSYDTLNMETQTAFLMACVCFYDSVYDVFRDVMESILPNATTTRLIELGLLERHSSHVRGGRWVDVFIKMHDLVRNLGFQMAAARKCAPTKMLTCKQDFLDINDEISWSEMKWLRVPALEDGIEAQLLEKCGELEVIVLDTHVNGHFGNPPQHLKVLIWRTASSLPLEVLEKLKELVYLSVQDPFIEAFPVAPSTRRLQVLHSFSGGSIPKEAIDLHKNTLRKLSCVRTAELSPYFCEEMTKLQWLLLAHFEGQSFPEEMGGLASLELLSVSSSTIQELPQSLAHLKKLETLILHLENLKGIPSGVLGELKELKHLQLYGLERVTSMPMEDIGQLASLELLELQLPSMERLTDADHGVSLKLEKLKDFYLWGARLSSLEGVRLSCPSLECLRLRLGSVEVLPSKFITGSTNLRSLRLQECGSLQELCAETEMLWAVESLAIQECPALKAIPEGVMKSVESLAVVGCPGLRELPADLDEHKAASMRFLACDAHLVPPQFLSLPAVLPYSPGDWRAQQQLHSFICDSFFSVSAWD